MSAMDTTDAGAAAAPPPAADPRSCAELVAAWKAPAAHGPPTEAALALRLAAGDLLVAAAGTRGSGDGRHVASWAAAGCAEAAAAAIRGGNATPAAARAQAAAMLANACHGGGHEAVYGSEAVAVAVCGGLSMEPERSTATVHDCAHVCCFAAKREVWGGVLGLDVVVERLAYRLWRLCCPTPESPRPDVARTSQEDLLVKKLFELLWRLVSHRKSDAFAKLCALDGRVCVLTAAISYVYDPRAQDLRGDRRPARGGGRPARTVPRYRRLSSVTRSYASQSASAPRDPEEGEARSRPKAESDRETRAASPESRERRRFPPQATTATAATAS